MASTPFFRMVWRLGVQVLTPAELCDSRRVIQSHCVSLPPVEDAVKDRYILWDGCKELL